MLAPVRASLDAHMYQDYCGEIASEVAKRTSRTAAFSGEPALSGELAGCDMTATAMAYRRLAAIGRRDAVVFGSGEFLCWLDQKLKNSSLERA
jgi:hypothetical protein